MAKETFKVDSTLNERKLLRLFLIGSVKKALGLSFHKDIDGYSVIDLSHYNIMSEFTGP